MLINDSESVERRFFQRYGIIGIQEQSSETYLKARSSNINNTNCSNPYPVLLLREDLNTLCFMIVCHSFWRKR